MRKLLWLAIIGLLFVGGRSYAQQPGGPATVERIDVTLAGNASASTCIAQTSVTTNVQTSVTVTSQPLWPRNVNLFITDSNASLSSLKVKVTGKNQYGFTVTESFTISSAAATTSAARITGSIAFATVSEVTYESAIGYTAGSLDSFVLGYGGKYGLVTPLALSTDVYAVDVATTGALETYSRLASSAYTVDEGFGTFAPDSDAAGSKYVIWLRPSNRVPISRQRRSHNSTE